MINKIDDDIKRVTKCAKKVALAEALVALEDLKNDNESAEYNRGICTAFAAIHSMLEENT